MECFLNSYFYAMESNIEKNSDEVGSFLESTLKSGFSAIPFVGGLLNEVVFEYSGRIKQERLNRFVELLQEYFHEKRDLEINVEDLKTEDFHDFPIQYALAPFG